MNNREKARELSLMLGNQMDSDEELFHSVEEQELLAMEAEAQYSIASELDADDWDAEHTAKLSKEKEIETCSNCGFSLIGCNCGAS